MTDWVPSDGPSDATIIELRQYREAALPRLPCATALFGRADELQSILELLAHPTVRLVSLTGRAGVGKTRLALEVARTLQDQDERPVSFVPLASVPSPDMVLAEIASQLGLEGLADAGPTLIARRLGKSGPLLVLDNFEHVLNAAGMLTELLEGCNGLQVLTTSQSPLRLRFERIVRVSPLPEPTGRNVAELGQQPAVALYCDRARAVDDRFRLGGDNADAIARLCRELEGLPLAIELAAARAATLSAAEVVSLIGDRRLDVLRAVRVDAPERHQDLRQALDWTYQLLGRNEKELLLRLSIVGGGFDLDDVEALSGNDSTPSLDALSELVDLHLVEPIPDTADLKFELLSSIREFAYEKLEASGTRPELEERFIRWMVGRAKSAAEGLDAPHADPWWRWIHDAESVLVRTIGLCIEQNRADQACELVSALAPLWNSGSFTSAHRKLVDEVIALAEHQQIATPAFDDAMFWSGLLLIRRLDADGRQLGLRRLGRARHLAEMLGDDRLRLRGLYFDVLVAPLTGDLEKAPAMISEGLKLADVAGSDLWRARFELVSGGGAEGIGDHQRAMEFGLFALNTAKRVRDGRTVLLAAVLLLPLVRDHAELARSLPPPEELRTLARSIHQTNLEISLVTQLAIEAAFGGDLNVAAQYGFEALSISGEEEFSFASAYGLVVTVRVAAAFHDHALAARIHGRVGDAVSAAMPKQYRDDYLETIHALRDALGRPSFESAQHEGAASSWSSTVTEAHEYLRGIAPSEQAGRPREERSGVGGVLTERQLEVVNLLASGLTNQEIAERLGVSAKTVMHHTSAIYTRLGVRGRSEAVVWAVRKGLVDSRESR